MERTAALISYDHGQQQSKHLHEGGQLQEVSFPLQGVECTATVLALIITPPSLVQCHKNVYNIFLLLLFLLLFKRHQRKYLINTRITFTS